MAEIIWFNDNGLQTVERDWCETDEQRGLKAKIEPQEIPEGIEVETRAPVVLVTPFDYNCPLPLDTPPVDHDAPSQGARRMALQARRRVQDKRRQPHMARAVH